MKASVINVRINETLKEELEILSNLSKESISKIVREAIELHLTKKINDLNSSPNDIRNLKDIELIQSLGFTELIFWIYEKRINPEETEMEFFYFEIIDIIEEMNHNSLFTKEVLYEFNKVLKELKALLYTDIIHEEFSFATDRVNGFNYEVLANFMYCIRYDDNNNEVIHVK